MTKHQSEAVQFDFALCTIEQQIILWRAWINTWQQKEPKPNLSAFTQKGVPKPKDTAYVVTLTLQGPSAAKEFEFYWPLIAMQYNRSWQLPELNFKETAWFGSTNSQVGCWRFAWAFLDFKTRNFEEQDTETQLSRRPLFPTCSVLASTALHLNNRQPWGFNLPGYGAKIGENTDCIPVLFYDLSTKTVKLSASTLPQVGPGWSTPELGLVL